MNNIFEGEISEILKVYIDDMIVKFYKKITRQISHQRVQPYPTI